jgi:hypothetical protein
LKTWRKTGSTHYEVDLVNLFEVAGDAVDRRAALARKPAR